VPAQAAAPSSAATSAPTKVVVTYANLIADHLPLWIAVDGGIFAKNGLDVTLQMVQSSAEVPALIAGQTQFDEGGASQALSAAVAGGDIEFIGTITPVYPFVFEVPASIQTPNDLKGNKVGVSGIGTSSDIAARVALTKMGLDPEKDVTIVTVGSAQDRRAALISGAIQGGVAQPPDSLRLEAEGFHPIYNLATSGALTGTNVLTVARTYASSHRDVVQKFIDSMVEAIAREKQDEAFSIQVLQKYLQYDNQDDLMKTWSFYVTQVHPSVPLLNIAQFDDAKQVLAASNPNVANFDVSGLLDNSFVQSAADRGLAAP